MQLYFGNGMKLKYKDNKDDLFKTNNIIKKDKLVELDKKETLHDIITTWENWFNTMEKYFA